MQVVKRIVGGFFLFILLLWLFAPKEELYYLAEKSLKQSDIVISNETIEDRWFGLRISDADIYVKGINVAKVANLQLNLFFFYNTLTIEGIDMDASLHNVAPKAVDELKATYSVIDPLHVQLDGVGSFGTVSGNAILLENKVRLNFPIAKDIRAFKKFLKKDKQGEWYYETNY